MRHHLYSNKDPQADKILSNYSLLLRGKPCYVRTVLRRSWVSVRHLSSDVTISVTMMTAVGARGSVVVKAPRYKPAGRGFDSRWCHSNFSVI
jgi:hypothetical protein